MHVVIGAHVVAARLQVDLEVDTIKDAGRHLKTLQQRFKVGCAPVSPTMPPASACAVNLCCFFLPLQRGAGGDRGARDRLQGIEGVSGWYQLPANHVFSNGMPSMPLAVTATCDRVAG